MSISSRPKSAASSIPISASPPMQRGALELPSRSPRSERNPANSRSACTWPAACQDRKVQEALQSHFDNVPIKPHQPRRDGQGPRYLLCQRIRPGRRSSAQFLGVYRPRNWINGVDRPSARLTYRHGALGGARRFDPEFRRSSPGRSSAIRSVPIEDGGRRTVRCPTSTREAAW